jgi:hypothetical protein
MFFSLFCYTKKALPIDVTDHERSSLISKEGRGCKRLFDHDKK